MSLRQIQLKVRKRKKRSYSSLEKYLRKHEENKSVRNWQENVFVSPKRRIRNHFFPPLYAARDYQNFERDLEKVESRIRSLRRSRIRKRWNSLPASRKKQISKSTYNVKLPPLKRNDFFKKTEKKPKVLVIDDFTNEKGKVVLDSLPENSMSQISLKEDTRTRKPRNRRKKKKKTMKLTNLPEDTLCYISKFISGSEGAFDFMLVSRVFYKLLHRHSKTRKNVFFDNVEFEISPVNPKRSVPYVKNLIWTRESKEEELVRVLSEFFPCVKGFKIRLSPPNRHFKYEHPIFNQIEKLYFWASGKKKNGTKKRNSYDLLMGPTLERFQNLKSLSTEFLEISYPAEEQKEEEPEVDEKEAKEEPSETSRKTTLCPGTVKIPPNLEHISFKGTNISCLGFDWVIITFSTLKSIEVELCGLSVPKYFQKPLPRFEVLTKLNISRNRKLEIIGAQLLQSFPNLLELDISETYFDKFTSEEVLNNRKLEVLRIDHCEKLDHKINISQLLYVNDKTYYDHELKSFRKSGTVRFELFALKEISCRGNWVSYDFGKSGRVFLVKEIEGSEEVIYDPEFPNNILVVSQGYLSVKDDEEEGEEDNNNNNDDDDKKKKNKNTNKDNNKCKKLKIPKTVMGKCLFENHTLQELDLSMISMIRGSSPGGTGVMIGQNLNWKELLVLIRSCKSLKKFVCDYKRSCSRREFHQKIYIKRTPEESKWDAEHPIPSLIHLSLSGHLLQLKDLNYLMCLFPNLATMNLSRNRYFFQEYKGEAEINVNRKIRKLDLSGCCGFSITNLYIFLLFLKVMKNLEMFDISNNIIDWSSRKVNPNEKGIIQKAFGAGEISNLLVLRLSTEVSRNEHLSISFLNFVKSIRSKAPNLRKVVIVTNGIVKKVL